MVGYEQLAKMNTFTMDDVYALVNNRKTASSLVMRLCKKGYVKKIRNNLYTCVNLADGQVIASKYHIACAINETSYISHHSAFEYMGMSNQVFNEIVVSSSQRFTLPIRASRFDRFSVPGKNRLKNTIYNIQILDLHVDKKHFTALGYFSCLHVKF